MDQTTINRYQPTDPSTGQPGDIYAQLQTQYGTSAANQVAQAALSGDETQINQALTYIKFGPALNTSTADILGKQLATDPLGAPLAAADKIASNSLKDFFGGSFGWTVLIIGGIALFLYLGGLAFLSRKLSRA